MTIALIFDTETTGLPRWSDPSDHPEQPHIVELAFELWDGDVMIDSLDTLVQPPMGIPISDELVAIHGITTEMAMTGITKADAVARFMIAVAKAEQLVAHAVTFDVRMMRIEAARVTGEKWENPLPTFCTMQKSRALCKVLGPKARSAIDFKMPDLGEAYLHFTGEPFTAAHRAGPDTAAARRIYFELQKLAA